MKLLVLGRGYLGNEFHNRGHIVTTRHEFHWGQLSEMDNERLELDLLVAEYEPDAIVNCIGSADTRECEDLANWRRTAQLNTLLPQYLSNYCNTRGIKFVHISTGCLYDGQTGSNPADENAPLETHCHYTVSKQAGENYCDHDRDLIIRPRLLFSQHDHPANLLKKLQGFNRYLNAPNSFTSLRTIVDAVEALVEADQSGAFNVAQTGHRTLAELASLMGLTATPAPEEEIIYPEELREGEGIYLVNNVMDISKLQEFYKPKHIDLEVLWCYAGLKLIQKRSCSE